jgi:hypothetical protein
MTWLQEISEDKSIHSMELHAKQKNTLFIKQDIFFKCEVEVERSM